MTPVESRNRLAELQQELVLALTDMGPPPPGFDHDRLRLAAETLGRKRIQAVAKAWPALAQSLGTTFSERFSQYSATHPLPRYGGALADGRFFAQHLLNTEALHDKARLEILAVDIRYVKGAEGLRPRGGAVLKCMFFRESRRLVFAGRLPVVGEFRFGWRLGSSRATSVISSSRPTTLKGALKK